MQLLRNCSTIWKQLWLKSNQTDKRVNVKTDMETASFSSTTITKHKPDSFLRPVGFYFF